MRANYQDISEEDIRASSASQRIYIGVNQRSSAADK
jgi:hypothetical protein